MASGITTNSNRHPQPQPELNTSSNNINNKIIKNNVQIIVLSFLKT